MFASIFSFTMKRNPKYLLLNTLDRWYIENFLKIFFKSSWVFSCLGLPTFFLFQCKNFTEHHGSIKCFSLWRKWKKSPENGWKKSWFQKEFWKGGLKVSKVLNAVPDSRWSLGDPAPAEVDWNEPSCQAPGCLVIDHRASVGLRKQKDILGEAKALLFTQPPRGRTDARCLKSYKYVFRDLSHKDASTHNFLIIPNFPWREEELGNFSVKLEKIEAFIS